MEPQYHPCRIEDEDTARKYVSNIRVLGGVGVLTSILSFFGSLSIIIFSIAKHITCHAKVKPLFHLTCADLLLSLCWISASWAFFSSLLHETNTPVEASNALTCFIWQLLTQIVHMVTFFLTLNYSLSVFYQLSKKVEIVFPYDESQRRMACGYILLKRLNQVFTVISWFLPTILLIPIMARVNKERINVCKQCVLVIDIPTLKDDPLSDYSYIVWVISLCFVIVSIIILYVLTLKLYWYAVPGFRTNRERERYQLLKIRISCYIFVFFLCWTPSLIIASIKWYDMKHLSDEEYDIRKDLNKGFPLYLFQAICAPLQGFLNSLVYGWTRKSFRNLHSDESTEQHQEIIGTDTASSSSYYPVPNYRSINSPPLGY